MIFQVEIGNLTNSFLESAKKFNKTNTYFYNSILYKINLEVDFHICQIVIFLDTVNSQIEPALEYNPHL